MWGFKWISRRLYKWQKARRDEEFCRINIKYSGYLYGLHDGSIQGPNKQAFMHWHKGRAQFIPEGSVLYARLDGSILPHYYPSWWMRYEDDPGDPAFYTCEKCSFVPRSADRLDGLL